MSEATTDVSGLEMRKAYATVVADLFREHPDEIFAMEADLSSPRWPPPGSARLMGDHYVNVGIMESHMVSASAGINISGGFAFVHSFGQFLARRAMDQIFVSWLTRSSVPASSARMPASLPSTTAALT